MSTKSILTTAMLDACLRHLQDYTAHFPPFLLTITDRQGRKTFYSSASSLPVRSILQDSHLHCLVGFNSGSGEAVLCREGCCAALGIDFLDLLLVLTFAEPLAPQAIVMAGMLLKLLSREIQHSAQVGELQAQIEFGEQIVRSMSSGFLVLAPDLTIANANPAACALLGVSRDKLLHSRLTEFVLSPLQVKQVFVDGQPIIDREVVIKTAKKNLRIMKTAVPVFDKSGTVIAALDHFREIREAHQLATRITGAQANFTFKDIIHQSDTMREAVRLAKMAATNSLSVLITGESGTGKELFAHAIHMAGQRCAAPFVVIDCASIPRDLVASELFGYVAGAFTGARKEGMPGKFELADGGTVFLDELGELPLEIQSQFLRVLQNRQVMRLGGSDMIPVNIRVIAATNRNLAEEVMKKNFREDLFYRLNVINIYVPPLRCRPEDVLLLAGHFAEKYSRIIGKSTVSFSEEVLAELIERSWPGNVRELENIIARAVHFCDSVVETKHIQASGAAPLSREAPLARIALPFPCQSSIKDVERQLIEQTIAACGGNMSNAAKQLGIARSTLYKKMLVWTAKPTSF